MRKLLALLVFSPTVSMAAQTYEFVSDADCSLKKFVAQKWESADASEVMGVSFPIQKAKNSNEHALFKHNGTWYSAKNHCYRQTSQAPEAVAETSHDVHARKSNSSDDSPFNIELRGTFSLMTGKGTGSSTDTSGGLTTTTEKYKPSIGFGGRFGYLIQKHHNILGEFGYFTGSQTITGGSATAKSDEKILNFNVGYQYYFTEDSFVPFVGALVGLGSLSGTTTASSGGSNLNVTYSSSSINLVTEVGAIYKFAQHFGLVGSLSYTVVEFKKYKVKESNSASFVVGTESDSGLAHSRIGINLGLRFDF